MGLYYKLENFSNELIQINKGVFNEKLKSIKKYFDILNKLYAPRIKELESELKEYKLYKTLYEEIN